MTSHSAAAPIFIFGYLHSGTTLLQRIIGRNSAVFRAYGETRFFRHLLLVQETYADLADEEVLRDYLAYLVALIHSGYAQLNDRGAENSITEVLQANGITPAVLDELQAQAVGTRDHAALFPVTYEFLAHRVGKQRWLDKDPGYVPNFNRVIETVPDALVLELVRDPRDILASKKRRLERGSNFHPYWDTLSWRTAVRGGNLIHQRYPERIMTIRYEDLVADAEATVRHICDFLNLDFEPQMLEVGWINSTTENAQAGSGGISTAAVGKWQKELAPPEVLITQKVARVEMAAYEYTAVDIPASQYVHMPLLVAKGSGEIFYRLGKRWHKGGLPLLRNGLREYAAQLRTSILGKKKGGQS